MIDNLKIYVNNKDRFEHGLRESQITKLTAPYDQLTGEMHDYPLRGRYKNLQISITEKQAYIKGSIHSFFNSQILDKKAENFDDFSYCDVETALDYLCHHLGVIKQETKVTNLEFGFNLVINKNPKEVIEKQILMMDYASPNRNQKFRGRGAYKEFERSDYSLKIYDKSLQYKIKGMNILRVELKITKARYLQKLGIYNVSDINRVSIENLFPKILALVEKLTIVDTQEPSEILEEHERVLFMNGLNPNYWSSQKNKLSRKEFNRLKKDFEGLLKKANVLNTKNYLLELMDEKFQELKDCNLDEKYLQIAG